MKNMVPVITGVGIVAPNAIGKERFWQHLAEGRSAIGGIAGFRPGKVPAAVAGEVRDFQPEHFLGPKGLRNLDRSALFTMTAAKLALDDAGFAVTEKNAGSIGVCTGTAFTHLQPIAGFDREVHREGVECANPGLFPSTVINAASSQVSIKFKLKAFNTTISAGCSSGLESLRYALKAMENGHARAVLAGGVDVLSSYLLFVLSRMGYLAGREGPAVSCPFDARRNGLVPGEAAAMLCLEEPAAAKKRGARALARVRAVASYFDAAGTGRIDPTGRGLEEAVRAALDRAGVAAGDIDLVAASANSSKELDAIEAMVLGRVFGERLADVPVSAIKSMTGETFSASGVLQAAAAIGAMHAGIVPPTINFHKAGAGIDVDCVPNKARRKDVRLALVTAFGPDGYNSACVLERA